MPHVTVLLYENALTSSISLPVEMLTAADHIAKARRQHPERLTIDIAANHEAVNSFGYLQLIPNRRFEAIEETDLIILPAIWRSPHMVIRRHPNIIPWLKRHAGRQTLICAVGSASNLLAEAGLLDDKPATTHWYDFDRFAEHYPEVQLQTRHLITQADNLYCVGSVNTVADLMVHFVTGFYGNQVARQVERHFSPEIRQSYQQHLYSQNDVPAHHDEDVVRAQTYLQTHYGDAVTVSELAEQIGLSVRSLNRRFRQATGMTPVQYLQKIRISVAEDLLKNSNLSLSEVAEKVGYSDYSHFAELFKKWVSTSPKSYRQSVRGKLFSPGITLASPTEN